MKVCLLEICQVLIFFIPINIEFSNFADKIKGATGNKTLAVLEKLTLSQSQFQKVLSKMEVFFVHS